MSHVANENAGVDDKTTMRRLGMAILAMCCGTIGIVILAVIVGHLH